MYLLNTETHELVNFEGHNVPLYAILSHTWGGDEIVFQDIGNADRCTGDRYEKVRMACSIAKHDGFDYVWIDTCCIDKTSSSDLSESINSMYRWYQEASICYAYLADVPSNAVDSQTGAICSEFFESRWFTRGWTLQELIAPSVVIFLGKMWERIGTKSSLKATISKITGIPQSILQEGDLKYASIAQRMFWASKRQTTRIEDNAYCLMGIFGVNMPMLYGEGERAFIRLQEEIMKVSDDHSLFAWESCDARGSLLANSPAAFSNSSKIIPVDSSSVLSGTITINNKGTHLRLRFMDIERLPTRRVQLAILPCAVEGEAEKKVGIYVKAISEAQKYFARTRSNRLELINLTDSNRFTYIEENICVRHERQTYEKKSTLAKAAEKGNEQVVKLLLREGANPDGTALASASGSGHEAIVRLLLEKGADLDWMALTTAIENGHEAVVRLLLERGADLDGTALVSAAENGHEAVVKLLLEKGADPRSTDRAGWTALRRAAEKGHEAVVTLLLWSGVELNRWALVSAAENGHEAVVRLLLENGADPDEWALASAVEYGHEAVVKLLLEKGADPMSIADPRASQRRHGTALALAAGRGHLAVVKLLLNSGVALDEWALPSAAENGHEAVVELLLEKSADLAGTALTSAAEKGHETVVRLLLEKGVSLNKWALITAAGNGHKAVVRLLLEKGANLDSMTLASAVKNGHKAVVRLLLEKGAVPDELSLASAVKNGHEAVVRLLLERGANPRSKVDPRSTDIRRGTVLALAAENGYTSVVKLLLDKGAFMDSRALVLAAENGHETVVKLLLEYGADPKSTDRTTGWTALRRASENGHEAVVMFLLENGAE